MARPRLCANDADRQYAYRARKSRFRRMYVGYTIYGPDRDERIAERLRITQAVQAAKEQRRAMVVS